MSFCTSIDDQSAIQRSPASREWLQLIFLGAIDLPPRFDRALD
jgi:hypothetical protein